MSLKIFNRVSLDDDLSLPGCIGSLDANTGLNIRDKEFALYEALKHMQSTKHNTKEEHQATFTNTMPLVFVLFQDFYYLVTDIVQQTTLPMEQRFS